MTETNSYKISDLNISHIGKQIRTFGWIESIRSAGRAGTFIDLFYGCKTLKCLVPTAILQQAIAEYEKTHKPLNLENLKITAIEKNADSANTFDETIAKNNSKHKVDKSNKQSLNKSTLCTNLVPHSSIYITAEIKENFSKKDLHKHQIEAHISQIVVYRIAPPFPINEESSLFTKLHLGHLNLRTKERILFLQARNELMHLFRQFYYQNNYIEVTPPTLVQTQVEGGSTLFSLDYYGSKAFLTQSSQLYLETVSPSVGKVFCIMPSYRAEKFNTTRHLSEYTHIEGEMSFIDFNDLMCEIEKMLKFVLSGFLKKMKQKIIDQTDKRFTQATVHKNKESTKEADGKCLDLDSRSCFYDSIQNMLAKSFIRLEYSEAIEILIKNNIYKEKETQTAYKHGDDISDRDEVALCAIYNTPIFLTNFPMEHKPFYCRKAEKIDKRILNNKNEHNLSGIVTESCDLLWPGIGEILGGSMRCEDYEELLEGFKREEIDPKDYYWYLDLRLFNADVHGGYGLGFERLLKAIMDYKNVNEACLYPRFPGRCEP